MIIILLGEGCNISWGLQKINLRGPTCIFEWFLSVSFKDINIIVEKILNNKPIEITKRPDMERDIYLDITEIRSAHYDLNNFPERLQRRIERFKEQILLNEPILFIREEHNGYITTEDDISNFKQLIETFNPKCNYKILLIMPLEIRRDALQIENVYHKENLRGQFNLLNCINEIQQSF